MIHIFQGEAVTFLPYGTPIQEMCDMCEPLYQSLYDELSCLKERVFKLESNGESENNTSEVKYQQSHL